MTTPPLPEEIAQRLDRHLAEAESLARLGNWQFDLLAGRTLLSPGMCRILGLEPGEAALTHEDALRLVHPDDRPALRALLAAACSPATLTAPTLPEPFRAQRPDGTVVELRARGRLEHDEHGRPVRWLGSAQDITEQRRAERELRAHHDVALALLEWKSFDEGLVGFLRRLGTALDFPLATLWAWDDGRAGLCARAFWCAPGLDAQRFEQATLEAVLPPGRGVPGRVWQTREPIVDDHLATNLPPERRGPATAAGLCSGLAFPAASRCGPLGVVAFYATERRGASDSLLRTLRAIGDELGRFLAARRADLARTRPLSERELEVLRLAAEGNSGPAIAERLVVSPATVKTHFQHIYEKLGVGDRAAAVAHALRVGLLE